MLVSALPSTCVDAIVRSLLPGRSHMAVAGTHCQCMAVPGLACGPKPNASVVFTGLSHRDGQ